MWNIGLLLTLMLTQPEQFQISGEIISPSKHAFQRVEIQSIDRRFVKYADVDFNDKFVFKKIPEGLYKLVISGAGRREEHRTIEVRPAFADARGRVVVKIELPGSGASGDQLKVGVAALGVSRKAADELRRAYDAQGDIEKARRHLQKAIDIAPHFTEALNNLGTIYYHDKKFDKAAELFERALQANPNYYPARVNLGGALISLGDYPRALTENFKALAMRNDDSLALSQTGQTLFHLKRYDEAIVHLEAAKRIDPMSFTLPGLFIAQIHRIRGNTDGVIAEYREFLKVHPGHPETLFVQSKLREIESQSR